MSAVAGPPNWLVILFLAISILVVYGRSLDAPFVLDDRITIVENPSIQSLWPLIGPDAQPGPLNPPADLPTSARPLVNLSFAVNYWLHGTSVVGYRLVNVLFHIANVLLLWAIIRRTLFLPMFNARFNLSAGWLAFLVALLWALHPLQTEAVIYITQRTELMVAFFYLATLYCSLNYWTATNILPLPPGEGRGEGVVATAPSTEPINELAGTRSRTNWLILATLSCFCGMASKEVMVSAPLIVLLYQRAFVTKCLSQSRRGLSQFCGVLGAKWDCPPRREGSGIGANSLTSALRRSWPLYVGLAASWLLLLALNINSPRGASAGFHLGLPVVSWWLTQCKVLFIYLKLAVWPSPLLLHYELPYLHTFSKAWMFAVPVAMLAAIAIVLLVRNRILGFLLAFVAAILAPTFVVPVLTEMAAERRMYLPLAALAALLMIGTHVLFDAWTTRRSFASQPPEGSKSLRNVAVACGLLALFYGLISSQRHNVYRNELQIWQEVVDHQPANYKALYNLGLELNRLGREPESLAALQKSVDVNPDFPDSRSALGFALINAHRIPEAIEMLNKAVALEPNHAAALNNLGIAYMRAGDLPKAIEHLKHAVQLAPNFANAHHNLGRALASNGQVDEALKELQAAASLTPNDLDVLNDLAMLFAASGQRPQAIELTRRILENRPDYAAAHHGLAMMLYESGDVRGSVDHFQRYLELVPNDVGAMCNLASVIATQGDFQNAALLCEQAARLAPDLPEAHFGLGTSLMKLGRLPEAIEHLQQAIKLRPNYFAAHVELAKALAAAGRPAQAIQIAEQGLAAARAANDQVHATQLERWLKENKR